jgi:hypothetical protein
MSDMSAIEAVGSSYLSNMTSGLNTAEQAGIVMSAAIPEPMSQLTLACPLQSGQNRKTAKTLAMNKTSTTDGCILPSYGMVSDSFVLTMIGSGPLVSLRTWADQGIYRHILRQACHNSQYIPGSVKRTCFVML